MNKTIKSSNFFYIVAVVLLCISTILYFYSTSSKVSNATNLGLGWVGYYPFILLGLVTSGIFFGIDRAKKSIQMENMGQSDVFISIKSPRIKLILYPICYAIITTLSFSMILQILIIILTLYSSRNIEVIQFSNI